MLFVEPSWKNLIVPSPVPILNQKECEEIIEQQKLKQLKEAKIGVATKDNDGHYNKKIRNSLVRFIPFDEMKSFYQRIEILVNTVNANFFGYNDIHLTEPAQFTTYNKKGFYNWHQDTFMDGKDNPRVRKISMSILLNKPNEFKGGELEFFSSDKKIKLNQGYGVFFASYLVHKVTPITKGTRKSLVMWFGGTPLK